MRKALSESSVLISFCPSADMDKYFQNLFFSLPVEVLKIIMLCHENILRCLEEDQMSRFLSLILVSDVVSALRGEVENEC